MDCLLGLEQGSWEGGKDSKHVGHDFKGKGVDAGSVLGRKERANGGSVE